MTSDDTPARRCIRRLCRCALEDAGSDPETFGWLGDRSKDSDMSLTQTSSSQASKTPPPAPVHDARTLVAGGNTANIDLDGKLYTLRITRAGKLILTK